MRRGGEGGEQGVVSDSLRFGLKREQVEPLRKAVRKKWMVWYGLKKRMVLQGFFSKGNKFLTEPSLKMPFTKKFFVEPYTAHSPSI